MAKRISDDIREWCDDAYSGRKIRTTKDLYTLADRIDAEMVELPKSADGKIWTGRESCFWTGATEGDQHEFHSLTYIDGRWCVEDKNWRWYPAASVWYERPDGLERIADELDGLVDTADLADDTCEKLADLADRIRRIAKKEG